MFAARPVLLDREASEVRRESMAQQGALEVREALDQLEAWERLEQQVIQVQLVLQDPRRWLHNMSIKMQGLQRI